MKKTKDTLFQQISSLKNLPALPDTIQNLIDVYNQSEGDLNDVSRTIEIDPTLSDRILKLINSSYYGLPHKVEDIDQAVELVGIYAIKNIAISASVFEIYSQSQGSEIFNLNRFLWHSVKCAVVARYIAKRIKHSNPDEAFLLGLLHDIGKLVLQTNFPQQYENLLEVVKDQQDDMLLEGESRMGATHSEIGAWLVQNWNLQSFMGDAILYHHEPKSRVLHALPLVQIVYVANALSRVPLYREEEALKASEEIFGFGKDISIKFLSEAATETEEVGRSLGLKLEPLKEPDHFFSDRDIENKKDQRYKTRNLSLIFETLQNLFSAENQGNILHAVHHGFNKIFGLSRVFFFLQDSEKDVLEGINILQDKTLSVIPDLIIPIKMGESIVIKSLHQQMPLDSFTISAKENPIILDEQIIRYTGKEGILCLPMLAHRGHVGVIVIGVNADEFSDLSHHVNKLKILTDQTSLALQVDFFRRNQLKTIQSERLRASSAIARKVFHEINNPLGIIKNYLRILGMKLSEHDIAQDEIRIINEEIDRVAQIIRELSTLSGDRISKKEPVAINSLLSDLVKISRESLLKNSKIELQLDLDSSIPPVIGDKNGLKQVFINIIKNAAESMADGGNLYIQTRHVFNTPKESNSPGIVEITIRDEGMGIPEEIKPQLFEPFVSSKDKDHPGLGLSIVNNIIKELNGTIVFDSQQGKGTVFKIDLPVYNIEMES